MTKSFKLRTAMAVLLIGIWPLAHAQTMAKPAYKAEKARITADYKVAKAACSSLAGNAKDVCVEEAKGKEKTGLAEAEHAYTGKASDMQKVRVVKVDAAYNIAKEKCDDKVDKAKDLCVEEAKTLHTKALADAKLGKEIAESTTDAMQDKREADHKLAVEKCNGMAGPAKTNCLATADAQSGKK